VALPGNHDVGLVPFGSHSDQLVSPERIAVFRAAFGDDRFCTDIGGWRLIGLNSQLIGSGLPGEAAQFQWLLDALDCASPVAVFMHYPAFIHSPQDEEVGHFALAAGPRGQLLDALRQAGNVRLVGSGHLHQARSQIHDGIRFEWAPSSAFVIPGEALDSFGGEQSTGLLLHAMDADDVRTTHIEPALMMNMDLRNWGKASPHGYYQVIRQPWVVGDLRQAVAA
jgi:3',5'-cyclic AMP phosphodiesterase CpdA